MWRGWGWSSGGGGIGGGGGGEALKTWVRYMSKKRAENIRKINPKVPYPEATSIAQSLFNLVKDRGPLTISSAWSGAQEIPIYVRHYTLYEPCDLHDCVKALHDLCLNSSASSLPAIREKYCQHKYKFAAKKYCPPSILAEYFHKTHP